MPNLPAAVGGCRPKKDETGWQPAPSEKPRCLAVVSIASPLCSWELNRPFRVGRELLCELGSCFSVLWPLNKASHCVDLDFGFGCSSLNGKGTSPAKAGSRGLAGAWAGSPQINSVAHGGPWPKAGPDSGGDAASGGWGGAKTLSPSVDEDETGWDSDPD